MRALGRRWRRSGGDGGDAEGAEGAEAAGATVDVTVLIVSCCWHKQRTAWREPLSSAGVAAGLRFPHAALKKACMALDASPSVAPRRARAELRELLRLRGVDEEELLARREMDGIQSRVAPRGLAALAPVALKRRRLEPTDPSAEELAVCASRARAPFERSRRLSLLEPLLGEAVEIACTIDRALALRDAAMHVSVFRALPAASDRNLAILAHGVADVAAAAAAAAAVGRQPSRGRRAGGHVPRRR